MAKKLSKVLIAQNKKARFDYHITETLEAGIVLMGSEVKSLRAGGASIAESYADEENGELFLINANIPDFKMATITKHEPRRHRKLLLKRRELNKLLGAIRKKGVTLVPLRLYFNEKGMVKLEIGLATGKKKEDKRASIKDREWKRDQARILKGQE